MCTHMSNGDIFPEIAAKTNVGQTLESKTVIEMLTHLMY